MRLIGDMRILFASTTRSSSAAQSSFTFSTARHRTKGALWTKSAVEARGMTARKSTACGQECSGSTMRDTASKRHCLCTELLVGLLPDGARARGVDSPCCKRRCSGILYIIVMQNCAKSRENCTIVSVPSKFHDSGHSNARALTTCHAWRPVDPRTAFFDGSYEKGDPLLYMPTPLPEYHR